jgi:hypothetical protein
MNKTGLILLMTLGMAAGAYAQTSSGGITVSNDPAKVAAVEKHAQELKARPAATTAAQPAATHTSSHTKAHASSHKAKPAAKHTPAAKPASKT